MTEKLFYSDPYCKEFQAKVLACRAEKDAYSLVLDRTAFYPEGGGQPCDRGEIAGIPVLDVHERQGEILHTLKEALPVGSTVKGSIQWQRRFDHMQNHSGEHLVSGLIHEKYGYDNVGFHMGSDFITIDFNGMIDEDGLREIEREANEAVWRDFPVEISWPTREELEALPYRSKKELSGAVRLVGFPGVDLCACCGTHVARTGEIGMISLFSCVKFHSGVRIEMLCGRRCLEYWSKIREQNHRISVLLSAKPLETSIAVERLCSTYEGLKAERAELEEALLKKKAEAFAGKGNLLLFEESMDAGRLRKSCEAYAAASGGSCCLFAGSGESWSYCICSEKEDVRPLSGELNGAFCGRGGGKPNAVQGSLTGKREELESFLLPYLK